MLATHVTALAALAALSSSVGAAPSDAAWPQFRGPNASGVAPAAKPPVHIGPGTNVQWTIDLPWAPSSPAIWDDHIYLTAHEGNDLETFCLRRSDGQRVWTARVTAEELEVFHRTDGSPAASTCATDGRHVVSYFGSFGLVCHDREGKELWRHRLPVAQSAGSFGTGTSPIIVGDRVILNRDVRQDSSLLALDVRTGSKVWESPRPIAIGSFGTPIVWNRQGAEVIVVPGSVELKAYDAETGRERWRVHGITTFSCTTPVVGEDQLYYGAWTPGQADSPWPAWRDFLAQHDKNQDGQIALDEIDLAARDFYRGLDIDGNGHISAMDWTRLEANSARGENVLIAVRPGGQGDITGTHIAWRYKKGLPYVPSPLFYQGRVYLIRDGGLITSLDANTGQAHYAQERLPARGSYYASPVAADGRLYLASLDGLVTVVRAGGDKPEVLHQADFKERIFATPALVGGHLYLRTASKLYAFGPGPGK